MQQVNTEGQLYLAGRSQCLPVKIQFEAQQLRIRHSESDEIIHDCSFSDISVSSKLASVPREIVLPNRDLISLVSSPQIDRWLDQDSSTGAIARFEKSKSWIAASVVLVPLGLFAIFKYLIPALAIVFAAYVPEGVSDLASRHTLLALDKTILDQTELSLDKQQQFQQEWASILAKLDTDHAEFDIQFRKSDKMGANAFALPNGTIVFTDELIALVDNNANLLSAILLHEIGHVEHRHSMQLIAETLVTSLAINYFFGDLEGMVEFFVGLSSTVVQNQFSQKLEWEADNYALSQMSKLDMNQEHFAQAMEKLAEQVSDHSKIESLLSSHPLLEDRINNARDKN